MRQAVTDASFTIELGVPTEPSVAALLRRSEDYAHSLYPDEGVHMLAVDELVSPAVFFFVARDNTTGEGIGCCALVLQPGGYGELKRMFVESPSRLRKLGREAVRRLHGVGAALMEAVEMAAREKNLTSLKLETGPDQPHAIALARSCGYRECGAFGDYQESEYSVFMEKSLDE